MKFHVSYTEIRSTAQNSGLEKLREEEEEAALKHWCCKKPPKKELSTLLSESCWVTAANTPWNQTQDVVFQQEIQRMLYLQTGAWTMQDTPGLFLNQGRDHSLLI